MKQKRGSQSKLGSIFRGVLNIVHGTHETVNRICDHPDIKAVSFVGSNAAGKYIYERASASGKRVQVSLGRHSTSMHLMMPGSIEKDTQSTILKVHLVRQPKLQHCLDEQL